MPQNSDGVFLYRYLFRGGEVPIENVVDIVLLVEVETKMVVV